MVMTSTKHQLKYPKKGQEIVEEQRERKQLHACTWSLMVVLQVRVIVMLTFSPCFSPAHRDQAAKLLAKASIITALLKLAHPVLHDVAISRCAKIIHLRNGATGSSVMLSLSSRASTATSRFPRRRHHVALMKCVAHLPGYLLLSQWERGGKSHLSGSAVDFQL